MKPQIVVGVIVAAVILGAGLLAPALRSQTAKQATQAAQTADLANRELAGFDPLLGRLVRAEDADALNSADVSQLVEGARDSFDALNQRFAEDVRDAQTLDRKYEQRGIEPSAIQPLRGDAAAVRSALAQFQSNLTANQALFDQGLQHARDAAKIGDGVPSASFALGMAQFVDGAARMADAQELRRQQEAAQSQLMSAAIDWRRTQSDVDYYAGLEVGPIIAGLRSDLEDIANLHIVAATDAAGLERETTQRDQELAGVRQQLQAARNELLSVEQAGFTAGDDGSFNAFRTRFNQISTRQRDLQRREQMLAGGGRRGAEFEDDDAHDGAIVGGETVQGLEELQRRAARARQRADKLAEARARIEEQIKFVEKAGADAGQEQSRHTQRLEQFRDDLDVRGKEISRLNKAAFNMEAKALTSVQRAVGAFAKAKNAAEAWKRDAGQLQRDVDAERKNERLNLINSRDTTTGSIEASAEAAARVAAGQIYAERVERINEYLSMLERRTQIISGSSLNPQVIQNAQVNVQTAQAEGRKTLNVAKGIYEKLSSGPAEAAWRPKISLAAVYYLLAKLDPARGAENLSLAYEAIHDAVLGREQHPWMDARVVEFHTHLQKAAGATPPGDFDENEFDDDDGG